MSPSICRIVDSDPEDAAATIAVAEAVEAPAAPQPAPPLTRPETTATAAVDWSRVRLGVDAAPTMFVASWSADTCCWDGGELLPYGPLSLLPAAQVLNYGQSIFEGLKAYRCAEGAEGDARVLLFRPDANASRFEAGAQRMCMPPVPPAMFLAALQAVVRANVAWVPPANKGSLYLRPLLLGTGPLLGLCPAPSYTFVVYAVPVGGRAKEGRLTALDYLIHDSLHRAAPRGVGSTKAAGNYSPCLMAQAQAREQGCSDCIYLDAKSDTYLEEGSGCNVFAAHGSVITTPPAAGSILPGITRASLLQLAGALGYGVREAPISVQAAMEADEMFASGTAVVVQPIGSVTFRGSRQQFCRHEDAAAGTSKEPAIGHAVSHANGHVNGQAAPSGGDASGEGCTECAHRTASDSGSEEVEEAGSCGGCGRVFSYGYGSTVAELQQDQRAALAACVPVPEPGSLPPGVGPIAQRLYGLLTAIQYGKAPDPLGWTMAVEMEGPTRGALHLDRLLGPVVEEGEELEAGEAVPLLSGSSAPLAAGAGVKPGRPGPAAAARNLVFADPNLE